MNAWNRSKSRQGFGVGFRIFDVVERVGCSRMTSGGRGRSKTHQASTPRPLPPWKLINHLLLFPALLKSRCSTLSSSCLVNGLKVGHAEFSKLYAYQYQPKFLALHFLPVALWVGYACRSRGSMLDSGRLYRSSIRAADALQEGQAKNKRRIRARRERIRRRIRR